MSGIFGIYYLDGRPVEPQSLNHMAAMLAHRGPDGSQQWSQGAIGLGHCMLWTTPESLIEQLPLARQDCVLTADARIDNRDELIPQLGLGDRPKETVTDSDIILAAYERWGDRCPAYLLGDFAFAIWDARQQRLFCARDPMGVKPFYYYQTNGLFVFASEIKALFTLPQVPRQLNEAMVADYLAKILFCGRKEDSFFQDIRELRATQSLVVNPDRLTIATYWTPDLSKELKLGSNEEYAEAFREIFLESVRCRLRSAFPVGSTLSGGLDSSSIASSARHLRQGNPPLHTFSAVFPSLVELSPKINERPYMDAVVAQGGYQPHWVYADRLSPLMDREKMFWHGEEPCPAPNFYMDWALFKEAQAQDVRVLFTGIDGDTTVTYGYEYLIELTRSFRWLKLIQEGTAMAHLRRRSPKFMIWYYGIEPIVPPRLLKLWRQLRGRPQPDVSLDHLLTLLNPTFAQQMGMADRLETDVVRTLMGLWSPLSSREGHWLDLNNGSVRYALQWLDKTAAAFSLEARHPFCDRRLIEFCIALPGHQKLQDGWTRSILRRAMEGILPTEVQWRMGKGDLGANFRLRFWEHEQELLQQFIRNDPSLIEKYANVPLLQTAYSRYSSNPNGYDAEAVNLFSGLNLALWLQQSFPAERSLSTVFSPPVPSVL